MKESKRTHRFSVTLSFAPKHSSDRKFCFGPFFGPFYRGEAHH